MRKENKINYLVEKFQNSGKVYKPERMAKSAEDFFNNLRTLIYGGSWGGGSFGGGGTSNSKFEKPIEIIQKYYEIIPVTRTFNDAFADARKKGLSEFEFNGGIYSTLMSDNPGWYDTGNKRVEVIGGIPIEKQRIIKKTETSNW